jgi:glucan 1,3-beta-glucosidase
MGIANAQRTLDYIRIITEFISQPEYQNVVPVFSIVNEATVVAIGLDQLVSL